MQAVDVEAFRRQLLEMAKAPAPKYEWDFVNKRFIVPEAAANSLAHRRSKEIRSRAEESAIPMPRVLVNEMFESSESNIDAEMEEWSDTEYFSADEEEVFQNESKCFRLNPIFETRPYDPTEKPAAVGITASAFLSSISPQKDEKMAEATSPAPLPFLSPVRNFEEKISTAAEEVDECCIQLPMMMVAPYGSDAYYASLAAAAAPPPPAAPLAPQPECSSPQALVKDRVKETYIPYPSEKKVEISPVGEGNNDDIAPGAPRKRKGVNSAVAALRFLHLMSPAAAPKTTSLFGREEEKEEKENKKKRDLDNAATKAKLLDVLATTMVAPAAVAAKAAVPTPAATAAATTTSAAPATTKPNVSKKRAREGNAKSCSTTTASAPKRLCCRDADYEFLAPAVATPATSDTITEMDVDVDDEVDMIVDSAEVAPSSAAPVIRRVTRSQTGAKRARGAATTAAAKSAAKPAASKKPATKAEGKAPTAWAGRLRTRKAAVSKV